MTCVSQKVYLNIYSNENMHNYYAKKLSAERLRRCYEVAPPRAQRYLEAEIEFVLESITPATQLLELGCGYGRVLQKLRPNAKSVAGIDTSLANLRLAQKVIGGTSYLFKMDAARPGFQDRRFDMVICIQNGISAFKVNQQRLIQEAMRITCPGGTVLFSSYSENFWEGRLEWFHIQAEQGLIGEIDEDASGDGVIVCKDGFRATTIGPDDFTALTSDIRGSSNITEVAESSVFCKISVM